MLLNLAQATIGSVCGHGKGELPFPLSVLRFGNGEVSRGASDIIGGGFLVRISELLSTSCSCRCQGIRWEEFVTERLGREPPPNAVVEAPRVGTGRVPPAALTGRIPPVALTVETGQVNGVWSTLLHSLFV